MTIDTIYVMRRSDRGVTFWSAFITPGSVPERGMSIPIVDWASAASRLDAVGFLVEQLLAFRVYGLANSVAIVPFGD